MILYILIGFILLPIPLSAKSSQPEAKVLMDKGDSCRMVWKFKKAFSFYQDAYDNHTTEKDVQLQLQLLERIMRTHSVLKHWKELPETSYQLYHLAKKHNDDAHISMALFMRGRRLYMQGQKEKGYETCFNALERMKNSNYEHKSHELAAYYAVLTDMYADDKKYKEAMQMSKLQEHYVRLTCKKHAKNMGERGLQRVYAIRIHVLANMGRMAEADKLYKKYNIQPVTDPVCGDALLDYYRLRGMNTEALRFLDAAMNNIREDGDTIGRNMLRLLGDEGDIYYRTGEYQKAALRYASMNRIADSISVRTLNKVSDEVLKVMESEKAIARHNVFLVIGIAGIVLLLTIIAFLLYQTIATRRSHRLMAITIRRLMHYRDIVVQNGDADKTDKNNGTSDESEEFKRFKEMDKRIMKERLFTQSDFGRDDLMRMMGVDKTALATLIQRYSGTNVPGYINLKRMEYAVVLMRKHPEYTLNAISEACGIMGSATFIRNFKNVYEMTPSEYRKLLEEGGSSPPELTLNNTKSAK